MKEEHNTIRKKPKLYLGLYIWTFCKRQRSKILLLLNFLIIWCLQGKKPKTEETR